MTDSILTSIKKLLGITEDYDVFDTDIIIHINSAFTVLKQLGYHAYVITGVSETWANYFENSGISSEFHQAVKDYVYLRVRMVFDPPANSFTQQALKDMIDELGWRLNVQLETEALGGTSQDSDEAKRTTNEMIDELW